MALALWGLAGPAVRRHLARAISTAASQPSQPATPSLHDIAIKSLDEMRSSSVYKSERVLLTPQGTRVGVAGRASLLNLCANNYLGLSNHPVLVDAAVAALRSHGFGLSSVRFICGTQDIHKELEARIAAFHGTEDAILFPSCFDANAGLFESLLGPEDAVISDSLNHASIIDGIRLCKAQRLRYRHADMGHLEEQLAAAQGARIRLVATDGVFSMDGDIAPLREIVALAQKYGGYVFVDDAHATGFVGPTGRGTEEACGLPHGSVTIINSTLGKALGGATGGYSAGPRELVDLLRQKARPYLFSNSVAPSVVAASLAAFDLLGTAAGDALRRALRDNTHYFRAAMTQAGFNIRPGSHPIVPVMLGDAALASQMALRLLDRGVYVVAFSYPVVPKGEARIRVQVSAAHTQEQLRSAVAAFTEVARELRVI